MTPLPSYPFRFAALLATLLVGASPGMAPAQQPAERPCIEDAMLVFDASGSMAGNGWGYGSETANYHTRIEKVRRSLEAVLPSVTRFRRVGLITYGPGPSNQCNVQLDFPPEANAARRIVDAVSRLVPAGRTPLTAAVERAADVLDYRHKPGIVVVLTDGEETCGAKPCEIGKRLHADADQLTVHVIGLRVQGYTWTGEQSLLDTKCLAERNGGLYIGVATEQELIEALRKTLDCPMLS
jgi:Ca-activated chloride channel family protein